MRKSLIYISTALLALGLIGCGSKKDDSSVTVSTTSEEAKTTADDKKSEDSDKKTSDDKSSDDKNSDDKTSDDKTSDDKDDKNDDSSDEADTVESDEANESTEETIVITDSVAAKYFTVYLSDNWKKYGKTERASAGNAGIFDGIRFYEKDSIDEGFGGHVFSFYVYGNEAAFTDLPSYEVIGLIYKSDLKLSDLGIDDSKYDTTNDNSNDTEGTQDDGSSSSEDSSDSSSDASTDESGDDASAVDLNAQTYPGVYYLVAVFPTDVQFSVDTVDNYETLLSELHSIVSSVTANAGYKYAPIIQ